MKKQTELIKKMQKTILSLSLIVLVLISCIGIIVIIFSAAWLHTYNAFTDKEQVAEITIIPSGTNEDGFEEFEVKYVQFDGATGLSKFIFPTQENTGVEFEETYNLVGDHVLIEAHTIKLADWMTLLNYDAIYKITAIEGDFINDKEKARNLPAEQRTIYDLNGGVDSTWIWLKDNERTFDFVFDTIEVSIKGKQIGRTEITYGVFITEEGLMIDESER